MKTLYVSDLDGTLLRSDVRTSEFTNAAINSLVARGMLFSYATARSYHTAKKAASGLIAEIPLIVYNGAMIVDNASGEFIVQNFFGTDVHELIDELCESGVFPIVYSFISGAEKFTFVDGKCSRGLGNFLETRKNDARYNIAKSDEFLHDGEIFYLTCIDEKYKLEPLCEKYRGRYRCVFQSDIYTGEYWLEIMPRSASKSNAIRQLKKRLDCDRLVVFGDGKNDIDMFELADEAYAVSNAVDELKSVATAVIAENNDDGVAKWLLEHAEF